jgi:hypothetical protein
MPSQRQSLADTRQGFVPRDDGKKGEVTFLRYCDCHLAALLAVKEARQSMVSVTAPLQKRSDHNSQVLARWCSMGEGRARWAGADRATNINRAVGH